MAVIFFLISCEGSIFPLSNKEIPTNKLDEQRIFYFNHTIYPQLLQHIKTGDIITRMGTDLTSELISSTNRNEKDFSHCGVILIENDSFFVYHAIGGPWNPDQKIKREPLYNFAFPVHSKKTGIFSAHLNSPELEIFSKKIRQWYEEGIFFDMEFDWESSEKMYCTEMVAKALIFASGDDKWLPKIKYNDKIYISIENLYRNKLVKEIWSVSY